MLANIKAYQSRTVSHCSPSQNSPSCCTRVVCLQKDHFWFWLVAAVFFDSNKMLWLYWLDRKERSFMSLVGYKCPLMGEKKLLFQQENLDSMLKSIFTWSPASILHLKMWILKMRALQAKSFEFLKFCISK